jgi:1,2-diacylglycerol 3-beta-galactosyltransferase
MRLLFLIADTGGGHRASAAAVARQLEALEPGTFEVSIIDPFAEGSPAVIARTAGLYGPITRHARWGWGVLYHGTNSRAAVAALNGTVLRSVQRTIARHVRDDSPAAVVSFHPLLNHVMVRAVAAEAPGTPTITVVTDLVDVHASWACPEVEAVVVPSPGGLDRARRSGIPASRCHYLGLPVDTRFTQPLPDAAARADLRRSLGLEPDRFTVLVCGGADGSGGIHLRARALAESGVDVQIAVITGHNRRAWRRLQGIQDSFGRPVVVNGFVDNMPDWLRAADVVATKAGPGTIAEALCCGVPLLLTSYLPGQERGNVEWVIAVGAGRYVPRAQQLIDTVAELSEPGSTRLQAMRDVVRRLARTDATQRIAELIARMARSSAALPSDSAGA